MRISFSKGLIQRFYCIFCGHIQQGQDDGGTCLREVGHHPARDGETAGRREKDREKLRD